MIPGSYVIYQSLEAMYNIIAAEQFAPINLTGITYISDEIAAANLELSILHHEAFDTPFS